MLKYLIIFFLITSSLKSQVSVSSPFVFMNNNEKQATLVLKNITSKSKEVELKMVFDYPTYDSLGRRSQTISESLQKEKSIESRVKVFPKRLVLKPKTEQAVKIIITGGDDFNPGSYWARLSITSKDQKKEIDTNTRNNRVNLGVVIAFESQTLVMFQKGELKAGVDVSSPRIVSDTSGMKLVLKVDKEGNSPVWTKLTANFREKDSKNLIAQLEEQTSIYDSGFCRVDLSKSQLKKGATYIVDFEVSDNRSDIPQVNKPVFQSVKKQFELKIPE